MREQCAESVLVTLGKRIEARHGQSEYIGGLEYTGV